MLGPSARIASAATPFSIVAALARNGVIGQDNALPWRLRTDLRRFRDLTWGRPIVMGRRTWDAIGRPLPGRKSIVLSRDDSFRAAGAAVTGGWETAKALAAELAADMNADDFSVVGGADLFRLALPEASTLHLTHVHASVAGDVLFPAFDDAAFDEIAREHHPAGVDDEYPFTFVELRRRTGEAPRRT